MGHGATVPHQGFGPPPMTTPGVGNATIPQQQVYGGTPMPGYGPPGVGADHGLVGPGSPMMAPVPSGGMVSSSGARPTTRNALMVMSVPFGCVFGGVVLGILVSVVASGLVGMLLMLAGLAAGGAMGLLAIKSMVEELNSVTKNTGFNWWMVLVPFFGVYWMAMVLPQEVTNAKRAVGSPEPVRSPVLYFFAGLYALASDLNDVAARMR
jgi:hypothetical protein